MDNFLNAVLGEVDSQICILWNLESLVHPGQSSESPLSRSSVHTTSVGFLAILDWGRDVDEEEVATRTCLVRDCLAYSPSSCIVRGDWCRNNCCASARELRCDKSYSLQVYVALLPRNSMI